MVFFGLSLFYRLAPRRPTRFAEVWAAALCATVLLRAGESLFVIYLKNFATLNAVYGAFGGIMALLLWIYLSGCVFIFGACLCAGQAGAPGQPAGRLQPTRTRPERRCDGIRPAVSQTKPAAILPAVYAVGRWKCRRTRRTAVNRPRYPANRNVPVGSGIGTVMVLASSVTAPD